MPAALAHSTVVARSSFLEPGFALGRDALQNVQGVGHARCVECCSLKQLFCLSLLEVLGVEVCDDDADGSPLTVSLDFAEYGTCSRPAVPARHARRQRRHGYILVTSKRAGCRERMVYG
jgi:hypothetical protein